MQSRIEYRLMALQEVPSYGARLDAKVPGVVVVVVVVHMLVVTVVDLQDKMILENPHQAGQSVTPLEKKATLV